MIRNRIRHTDTDDGRATARWQLAPGGAARILRLEVRDSPGEPDTIDLPAGTDLPTARELHPEHDTLWDKVRDERAAAVLDPTR